MIAEEAERLISKAPDAVNRIHEIAETGELKNIPSSEHERQSRALKANRIILDSAGITPSGTPGNVTFNILNQRQTAVLSTVVMQLLLSQELSLPEDAIELLSNDTSGLDDA